MKTNFNAPVVVSRKHWAAYIIPALLLLTGLLIFSLRRNSGWLEFDFKLFLGTLLISIGLLRILAKRKVKWTLYEDALQIEYGLFPWNKSLFQLPIYNIYEALKSHGMFGYFLKYGNLEIRRTEGVTSSFSGTFLTNSDTMMQEINSRVNDLQAGKRSPAPATNISTAEELRKLAQLLAEGSITQSDYEMLKQKAIMK